MMYIRDVWGEAMGEGQGASCLDVSPSRNHSLTFQKLSKFPCEESMGPLLHRYDGLNN